MDDNIKSQVRYDFEALFSHLQIDFFTSANGFKQISGAGGRVQFRPTKNGNTSPICYNTQGKFDQSLNERLCTLVDVARDEAGIKDLSPFRLDISSPIPPNQYKSQQKEVYKESDNSKKARALWKQWDDVVKNDPKKADEYYTLIQNYFKVRYNQIVDRGIFEKIGIGVVKQEQVKDKRKFSHFILIPIHRPDGTRLDTQAQKILINRKTGERIELEGLPKKLTFGEARNQKGEQLDRATFIGSMEAESLAVFEGVEKALAFYINNGCKGAVIAIGAAVNLRYIKGFAAKFKTTVYLDNDDREDEPDYSKRYTSLICAAVLGDSVDLIQTPYDADEAELNQTWEDWNSQLKPVTLSETEAAALAKRHYTKPFYSKEQSEEALKILLSAVKENHDFHSKPYWGCLLSRLEEYSRVKYEEVLNALKSAKTAKTGGMSKAEARSLTTEAKSNNNDLERQEKLSAFSEIQQKNKNIVEQFNQKHAVVRLEGRTVVLNQSIDAATNKEKITFSSIKDFRDYYLNRNTKHMKGEDMKEITWANLWLTHPNRKEYEHGVCFVPNKDVGPGFYNYWRGYAVEPYPGKCQKYLDHIKEVICSGDQDYYDYILDWMADAIQNPGRLPGVALSFTGGQGTGKGKMVEWFAELYGSHYTPVYKAEDITGRFNAHQADKLLVWADEALWPGDKKNLSILKALITQPEKPIEFKGKDLFRVKNYTRLIITTNDHWAAPAEGDDRRFFVLEVSDHRKGDYGYFAAIDEEMEGGGLEALLHFLQNRAITHNIRDMPQTSAMLENKQLGFDAVESWWMEQLEEDFDDLLITAGEYSGSGDSRISKKWLYQKFLDDVDGGANYYKNATKFGKKLNSLCPGITPKKPDGKTDMGVRVNTAPRGYKTAYILPDVNDARLLFEQRLKTTIWTEVKEKPGGESKKIPDIIADDMANLIKDGALVWEFKSRDELARVHVELKKYFKDLNNGNQEVVYSVTALNPNLLLTRRQRKK